MNQLTGVHYSWWTHFRHQVPTHQCRNGVLVKVESNYVHQMATELERRRNSSAEGWHKRYHRNAVAAHSLKRTSSNNPLKNIDPKKWTPKNEHEKKHIFLTNKKENSTKIIVLKPQNVWGKNVSGPGFLAFRPGGWRDPPFPQRFIRPLPLFPYSFAQLPNPAKMGKTRKASLGLGGVGCTSVFLVYFQDLLRVPKNWESRGVFLLGFQKINKNYSINI